NCNGRLIEKTADQGTVTRIGGSSLCRDGIQQWQLECSRAKVCRGSRARIAGPSLLGEMSNDIRALQGMHGLQSQQLRIARTHPDAHEEACGHVPGLASALIAAAAIALPPIRPRTTRKGIPRE